MESGGSWYSAKTATLINDTFYTISFIKTSSDISASVNGVISNTTSVGALDSTSLTYIDIGKNGSNSGDANRQFQGYIAEILYYNNSVSSTDKADIEQYLMNKYGIS